MRITVLFFAHTRDLAGLQRTSIDLPDGATVQQALNEIIRLHPPIATLRGRIAVAVNERYETTSATLSDGCTLALIPPVSGG